MRRTNAPHGAGQRLSTAVRAGVIIALSVSPVVATAQEAIDLSKWSPEYVRSIAGTATFDTAAECAEMVPLDYTGRVTVWYTGPTDAEPEINQEVRQGVLGGVQGRPIRTSRSTRRTSTTTTCSTSCAPRFWAMPAPMVVRLQILGGVEFAAKGYLQELLARGCGLYHRRVLARRAEVGDL